MSYFDNLRVIASGGGSDQARACKDERCKIYSEELDEDEEEKNERQGEMIKPICSLCKKELDDFGAIVLSPPDDNHKVEKYHICKACYCNNIFLLFYRNFDLLKGEK